MVVEFFPNVLEWLRSGLGTFLILLLCGAGLGTLTGFLVATWRHGPVEGFYSVAGVIAAAPGDLFGTSFRRIGAIARLAIKEALRRRVILVTFGIFAALLLFGGWYLTNVEHPERVYINFVMWGTQLLVLLVGLLISAFSLPEDIRNRTIFTVVTKPVRATEIVIGRIVGFGALVTGLLALMALLSYVFVWRGLSHSHLLVGDSQTVAALQAVDPVQRLNPQGGRASDNASFAGSTTSDAGHRHEVEIIEDIRDPNGPQPIDQGNVLSKETRADGKLVYRRVVVLPAAGHTHAATVSGPAGNETVALGDSVGYFRARRPIYADELKVFDTAGLEGQGMDVGREWRYRKYIDGGNATDLETLAKAEFIYSGLTPEQFEEGETVVLELTLAVFRTYLGNIQKRVLASIQIESIPENPLTDPKLQSEPILFETSEMQIQPLPINRRLTGRKIDAANGAILESGVYDLFEDFASGPNKRIKVVLRCKDKNQYIGVARADVYFRARDDWFGWNFAKGFIGIWAQMMIVVAIGVALSTILSAPVTILCAMVMFLVGFASPFIRNLLEPSAEGGGPVESLIRILRQENMVVDLETTWFTTIVERADDLLLAGLNSLTWLAPSFRDLDFSRFLTWGYSVSGDRLAVAILISLAFCFGASVFGYFCLKTREIAGQT